MIRVRCYYRYSSDEQSDGWSIEAQDKACCTFIAARPDWQLTGQPYIDEAWSGRTVNRPAFQQMLQDARAGQFDVLVCHKLDRFSRSLIDVLLTLDELQKYNVTFASATESIDFTSASGRMMLVMLAYFAEWYLQNLSAETTKGKQARWEAGYWNGDMRFGYSKAEAGEEVKNGMVKKLYKPVPNADAKFVVMAYEMCAAGKIDQEIADELNRLGSRTYRLISNPKAKASPDTDPALRRGWVKDSVASLFDREAAQFYLGNMVYIGEKERKKLERDQQVQVRKDTHEAIITQELCDRAMASRVTRYNPGRVLKPYSQRTYLLGEGIAHCVHCGKPMRAIHGPYSEDYLYYRCAAWLRNEPCDGSRLQVREDALAAQLEPYMAALQLPDDWRTRVREMVAHESQAQSLVKRRDDLRSQLRRLNYQFEQGLIDEADIPAYENKAKRLVREINSIVISDTDHTIEICEQAVAFYATWGKADKAHRHAILKEMFEAVYIDTDEKCVVGVRPYAEFVPLLRQTNLVEHEGMFVLEKDETAQGGNTSGRLHVSGGRDGRRSCARREGWYRPRPRVNGITTAWLTNFSTSSRICNYGCTESAPIQIGEAHMAYSTNGQILITLVDESHMSWPVPDHIVRHTLQSITVSDWASLSLLASKSELPSRTSNMTYQGITQPVRDTDFG
jgi:DNA invertase Pin-like site-specific DNA recombinase